VLKVLKQLLVGNMDIFVLHKLPFGCARDACQRSS
jgi:hypothetical protein